MLFAGVHTVPKVLIFLALPAYSHKLEGHLIISSSKLLLCFAEFETFHFFLVSLNFEGKKLSHVNLDCRADFLIKYIPLIRKTSQNAGFLCVYFCASIMFSHFLEVNVELTIKNT